MTTKGKQRALQAMVDAGYTLVKVVPHRSGKDVISDVVMAEASRSMKVRVDALPEFADEPLLDLLRRLDEQGWRLFQAVPHRHGRTVSLDVVSFHLPKTPRSQWKVDRVEAYGPILELYLQALVDQDYQLHSIIPHRVGQGNFPVVVANRPL